MSTLSVYNGIFCCERDNGYADWHIAGLKALRGPIVSHCLYYGMGQQHHPAFPCHEVGAYETYQNLPLKTYGMFKHALTIPGWTHLLKTDVNAEVVRIKWNVVESHDLVGFVGLTKDSRIGFVETPVLCGRMPPTEPITEPILNEPFLGILAERWVGGPAYVVSRKLAELVVSHGVWYCRGFPFEDQMVSVVALQHGIRAEAGVGYIADNERLDENK